MADTPDTTTAQTWDYLIQRREFALGQLQNGPSDPAPLWEIVEACETTLLAMPAPSLRYVRGKLGMLWGGQLSGKDEASRHKLLVIDDLKRLDPAFDPGLAEPSDLY